MLTAKHQFLPPFFIPLSIFLFSFFLRLSLITQGPYHGDSLDLVQQARMTIETGELGKHTPLGFPLMVILAGIFIKSAEILGVHDPFLAINFLSVVFSSMAVLVFYLFIRRVADEQAAFFGALVFSVAPMFLGVSVYGKNHAPCVYFLLQGLYFLAGYFRSLRQRDLWLSGLFIGLMGAVRVLDCVLLALPISVWIIHELASRIGSPRALRALLGFWVVAGFVIALFYSPYMISAGADNAQEAMHYFKLSFLDNFLGIFSPHLGNVWRYFVQTLTWGGLIASLAGFILILREKKSLGVFLVLWLLVPVFLYYGNVRSVITSRYFVLVLPAFLVGLGYVLSWWSTKDVRLRALANVFVVILALKLFVDVYPVLKFRHDQATLPRYMEWVGKITEKDAVIITADEGGFAGLFAQRETLARPLGEPANIYRAEDEKLHEFKAKLDRLLSEGRPVYITEAALYAYNRDNYFVDFMNAHYRGETVGTYLYEDWHSGEMALQLFWFDLYRVSAPGL